METVISLIAGIIVIALAVGGYIELAERDKNRRLK